LITRRGLAVLRDADVVVYDRLTSPELLLEARTDARVHYVGKSSSHHALSQTEINRLLVEEAKAGRSVCRLKGGDPFLFGRGGEEADHLVEQGVSFEVVPGVTSAVAVPAYAGIPVTDRRAASSLAIVTGQEEGEREGTRVDWQRLARAADTLVVLMGVKNLKEITRELLSGGREAITPSALIRWGTTGQQQTIVSTLAQIAAEAERRAFAAPAILVVGEVVTMARRLNWFEPRPLRGLRVLVARPRQQASALADLLRAAGAEPVVCSLIRTEPVAVDAARLQALCEQTWGWVLFTSANGVSHFGKLIQQAGLDWRCLAGARIGAMGPGTAAELRQRELVVDFVPSRSVAESLAAELPEVSAGTRILLARAEEAREVLPRLLRERGAAVEVLTVYRTLPDEEGSRSLATALEAGEVDVITLTSASTVRQLTRLASTGTLARYTIASIGPITSQAAREAGLQVDIEAQEHTIPGLVAALAAYSAERKKQA
jgi:uroporphyrinogen III methyltransferase/synthase